MNRNANSAVLQVYLHEFCPTCDQKMYRTLHRSQGAHGDMGSEVYQCWVQDTCEGHCNKPLRVSPVANWPLLQMETIFEQWQKQNVDRAEFDRQLVATLQHGGVKWDPQAVAS